MTPRKKQNALKRPKDKTNKIAVKMARVRTQQHICVYLSENVGNAEKSSGPMAKLAKIATVVCRLKASLPPKTKKRKLKVAVVSGNAGRKTSICQCQR